MFQQVLADLKGWADAPFSQQMSLMQIVLLIGLVMIVIAGWARVLSYLSENVEI